MDELVIIKILVNHSTAVINVSYHQLFQLHVQFYRASSYTDPTALYKVESLDRGCTSQRCGGGRGD